MKKRLFVLGLIGLMALSMIGCKKNEPDLESAIIESTIEETKSDVLVDIENDMFSDEEREQHIAVCEKGITETLEIMFNFDTNTPDYTEHLLNKCCSKDICANPSYDAIENCYYLFSQIHQESQFISYTNMFVRMTGDAEYPTLKFGGIAECEIQSDKLNYQTCSIPVYSSFVYLDGEWQIYDFRFAEALRTDGFRAEAAMDEVTGKAILSSHGTIVTTYDFVDVEGYLTNYQYGNTDHTFNPEDYDIVEDIRDLE